MAVSDDILIQIVQTLIRELLVFHREVMVGMDKKLDALAVKLDNLPTKENFMAFAGDVKTLITQLNSETDLIAAKLTAAVNALGGNPTPAEQAEILSSLTGLSDRLTALGKDPENPIPTPA